MMTVDRRRDQSCGHIFPVDDTPFENEIQTRYPLPLLLFVHSYAVQGDAIILGASKLSHLEDNMSSCIGREPLPKALVRAINVLSTSSPLLF